MPAPRGEGAPPVAGPSGAFGGGYAGTVNAQIEFFRNGDFITRSNNVESVYRRVNPDDWDDDGLPNEDDPEPHCRLPDPSFIAEAGATNRVVILIGKEYRVQCDMPFEIIAKSDPEIDVWIVSPTDQVICWRVVRLLLSPWGMGRT